jgi:hypothetical protein
MSNKVFEKASTSGTEIGCSQDLTSTTQLQDASP